MKGFKALKQHQKRILLNLSINRESLHNYLAVNSLLLRFTLTKRAVRREVISLITIIIIHNIEVLRVVIS